MAELSIEGQSMFSEYGLLYLRKSKIQVGKLLRTLGVDSPAPSPGPASPSIGVWQLIGHSTPQDRLNESFAWVIAAHCNPHSKPFVPALGLEYAEFTDLLHERFPHFVPPGQWLAAQTATPGSANLSGDFSRSLQILGEHSAKKDMHHRYVAHLIATACMGEEQLWLNLGLPDQKALTELLLTHFPTLSISNGNLEWRNYLHSK